MKFLSSALFLALPALSLAQGAVINNPKKGETFAPGEFFSVTVYQPRDDSPTSIGVATATALASCANGPCSPPALDSFFGTVLEYGPYSLTTTPPVFQNFTVKVPDSWQAGPAQLNFAYFSLIGAGSEPNIQLLHVEINIS
ncbi:hypothetical protein AX14_013762 [Amanita brunnescens Koide BX004]|nr:hypothetical protein AX14_003438 [Amanita brunnescens Koide BX004]KAF8706939.1 hypothetical protein AX14_013762 [Amanita brunnescens Koide BX004]